MRTHFCLAKHRPSFSKSYKHSLYFGIPGVKVTVSCTAVPIYSYGDQPYTKRAKRPRHFVAVRRVPDSEQDAVLQRFAQMRKGAKSDIRRPGA